MHLFKKNKYSLNNIKFGYFKIILPVVFIFVVCLTIGFSAFNVGLDVSFLANNVIVSRDIRVTGIALNNTSSSGVSNWQEHGLKSISTNIDLPNANSTVSYEVEVTNVGNIEMGIASISGIPNNLEYEISGYTVKDELCDYQNQSTCKLGSVSKFIVTFSYDTNGYDGLTTNHNIKLDFDFRRFYNINYFNLDDTNLPRKAIETDNINIQFNTPYPDRLQISGNSNNSYNANTGILSINNVDDDIDITYIDKSYFAAYDGATNLFNNFDKTNITSFSRNTSLTLEQVQAKVNNNQAFVVSTSYDDANYPSNHEIYAWVDNNHLYWWSLSNVVYFHPNTRNAFRAMSKITNINLTGTNTSMVKNFSNWFDTDILLSTITGRINTSGLELVTSPSYNFANDTSNDVSSGLSLAFMFNDCKVLTAIDLSEFDTHNAIDMKRMFGGCAKLTSIDVSGFDTSNVRSMYWMFRKTNSLTEIDVRNFNTANVENMYGMFVESDYIQKVYLGLNFNTSKVKKMSYMFYSMDRLTTIYAYNDFQIMSGNDSVNMFNYSTHLVGSANTIDETLYNSVNINATYAKLASNGVRGYFTPYNSNPYYTISYDLDGGIVNGNPTIYYENTQSFTLNNPVKQGYSFIGWTGSNGNVPQLTVTITTGTTGNLSYVANYEESYVELFPTVFAISGTCNFNGSNQNITGNTCVNDLTGVSYTNSTYIDTGINLYNSENLYKDFEIYFEISNYNPSLQETMPDGNQQNTIMNTKAENVSGYPGLVVRKKSDSLEIKSFTHYAHNSYSRVNSYTIRRVNKIIYYSINGGNMNTLDDNTSFNSPFNLSLWFGASKNSSGNAFRHAKCTLSNMYVKLGTFS